MNWVYFAIDLSESGVGERGGLGETKEKWYWMFQLMKLMGFYGIMKKKVLLKVIGE